MAILGEKEPAKIAASLLPLGEKVVFTRPSSSRRTQRSCGTGGAARPYGSSPTSKGIRSEPSSGPCSRREEGSFASAVLCIWLGSCGAFGRWKTLVPKRNLCLHRVVIS